MSEENKTFGAALEAARSSFGTEQELPVEQPAQEASTAPQEQPVQDDSGQAQAGTPPTQEQVTEEAIATAEQAAAIAQQKDAQVSQLTRELEAERQKSAQLEDVVHEMSQQKEEQVIEEALTPPVLDLSPLIFEGPEAIAAAQAKYTEDMAAYQRKSLEKEYAPIKAQARRLEESEILQRMASDVKGKPEFEGFDSPEMQARLRTIIEQNEFLKNSDLPYDRKLINAYAIARGADAMYTPKPIPEPTKEQTVDELMELYKNNPDFRAAIEKQRIAELNPGQQVPPLTASGGAGNVALNIKEKPQTFGEARDRAKSRFFH